MANTIDYGLVRTVARREAGLALRSIPAALMWIVLAVAIFALSAWLKDRSGAAEDVDAAHFLIMNYQVTWLFLLIMLVGVQAGASITDEKDKKVVEILLSAVRAEELYLGKVLGASTAALLQLLGIWGVVIVAQVSMGLVPLSDVPWVGSLCLLLFMILGYYFFTAAYTIVGSLVSKNEQFSVAQMPVLALFFVAYFVTLSYVIELGTLGQGWLATVGMIPPISMGAAPMNYFIGNGELWALLVSGVLLLLLAVVTLQLGSKVFRSRVIK